MASMDEARRRAASSAANAAVRANNTIPARKRTDFAKRETHFDPLRHYANDAIGLVNHLNLLAHHRGI